MLKYLVFIIGLSPVAGVSQSFPVLGSGLESCESLWVERNQILNEAGACFSSPLGNAVFDNGDCVPTPPVLSETALNRLAQIGQAEAARQCAINPDRESLTVNGRYGALQFGKNGLTLGRWAGALASLDVFPRRIGRGRSCVVDGLEADGASSLALRSGPDVRYPQIGRLLSGERVFSSAECLGRWCFADEVQGGNRQIASLGWFHVKWCRP
ncbi:MAG: YARHG domain-containing protein [Rhodobacteraceae bacterium]|nr:YARHG domain-containing protein [Paracoccaceae bacterium]